MTLRGHGIFADDYAGGVAEAALTELVSKGVKISCDCKVCEHVMGSDWKGHKETLLTQNNTQSLTKRRVVAAASSARRAAAAAAMPGLAAMASCGGPGSAAASGILGAASSAPEMLEQLPPTARENLQAFGTGAGAGPSGFPFLFGAQQPPNPSSAPAPAAARRVGDQLWSSHGQAATASTYAFATPNSFSGWRYGTQAPGARRGSETQTSNGGWRNAGIGSPTSDMPGSRRALATSR